MAGKSLLLLAALAGLPAGGLACQPVSPPPASVPGPVWEAEDWQIFEQKVRWGVAEGLDTLPEGEAIARLGVTFVGTTYRPATLEVEGPERLVINLRELDCVTFVENVLALVRFIKLDGTAILGTPAEARNRYEGYLRALRYRSGTIDGYPSRLHYFSDWLAENERTGRIRLVTRELGGQEDREPLTFMSGHPGSYRQMADSAVARAVRNTEDRLNAGPARWVLPEGAIAGAAALIRNGDLIAATSTLPGLDIAHTGFALWQNGELYLLHAPLVGRAVEISSQPLAVRIRSIGSQDGIMVARPLPSR
jgi:hypothetical protein